ncbi:hypothetical protein [Nitrincola nitratireducens]|uniref:Mobilization protein n=1 Tax=Nitrincola nitratireducens TaxID=1229521 RepID=W9UWC8_9GAMM|nr:hypothetical protein [Nitrincola nitratireducens]EXJ09036.1 hypothetical protein D791_04035 [Nitrincola nitratireducens]
MTKKTIEQQILEQEARLARLRKKKDAELTQIKIIVGALMLNAAQCDSELAMTMHNYLSSTASDRDKERLQETLKELLKLSTNSKNQPQAEPDADGWLNQG